MRFVFGTIALLAATVLVVISATTLFISAFTASVEPWQQWTNGTGTAAIVAWEACALTLIGMAWYRGYKPVAILATLLLVTAAAVTLKWEMRATVVGQADKMAERALEARHMSGLEEDLQWARDQRKKLSNRKDLDWINNRIEVLEKQRSATKAVAEVMPEASIAARITGHSEQGWRDFWMVVPLLFWTLARIVAFPLAIVGLISFAPARRQEPQRAEETPPATIAPEAPSSPATEALRDDQALLDHVRSNKLSSYTDFNPETGMWTHISSKPKLEEKLPPWDDDPKPSGRKTETTKPEPKAEADTLPSEKVGQRAVAIIDDANVHYLPKAAKKNRKAEGNVVRWLGECSSQTPDKRVQATSQECRRSYLAWCKNRGEQPVGHKLMSRVIGVEVYRGREGARGPRNGNGAVFRGLIVSMPAAEPMRKRA